MSTKIQHMRKRLAPADLFVRRVLLPVIFFVGICGLAHYAVTGNGMSTPGHAVMIPR